MNTYKLYWRDGTTNTAKGHTIAEAFTAAGFGAGALRALDYYECIGQDGEGVRVNAELLQGRRDGDSEPK